MEKSMLIISVTEAWSAAHPGASIGLLELSGVENVDQLSLLIDNKAELETRLRSEYADYGREEFNSLPVLAAYRKYYKRFKKTYHVQLQIESIVLRGKSLPTVSPLVDANFISELETLALTAGHDVSKLLAPIVIDVSREGDQITQMNGDEKTIRPADMIMRDAGGVSCSIIYGQDRRSPITASTNHVLYVTYAPIGISTQTVDRQMQKIEEIVRIFSPSAFLEQRRVITNLDPGSA
jgi:DNA/RNA-binding domain of Phe-tRNA-synthetase-like protein